MRTLPVAVLLALSAVVPSPASAARVLAALPFYAPSHQGVFRAVLKAMVAAGHHVVHYTSSPMPDPPSNYTNVFLDNFIKEKKESAEYIREISNRPYKNCFDHHGSMAIHWFRKFMENKHVQQLLTSKEKFDLIMIEPYCMQEFSLVLGHIFQAPTIAIQAFPSHEILNSVSGNSLSMHNFPYICSPHTDKMSFADRYINAYYILRRLYYYYNDHLPKLEAEMRRHFVDMPSLEELAQNVSLVLVNDHPTASYARPRTPNIIPVAGIHLQPPRPLPQDLMTIMHEASDGVILFSLGTLVSDSSSKSLTNMFVNVFARLKQKVIWKTDSVIKDLPSNVKTIKWLPQQDILAHENCILFITHGGLNSQLEAIHHGVPLITIPYMGDQPRNAMFAVAKGVGLALDKLELSESSVSLAIQTILGDPGYSQRTRALSSVFQDRPMSPEQTVVYWTEYVMRHGGAPHLRPATQPFYKRALLDVVAALVAAATVSTIVLYLLIVKTVRALSRTSFVPAEKKTM